MASDYLVNIIKHYGIRMTTKNILEVLRFILVALAFGLASLFVIFIWTGESFDGDINPYTISIEYDCIDVARDQHGYPQQVIEECAKIYPPKTIKNKGTMA